MDKGIMIGKRIVKRIIMSFSIIIVNALSTWTYSNMSTIQGICLVALIFAFAVQLNKKVAQPKLIRLIGLLYCNQQIRRLFIGETSTAVNIFPNILLATAIAVLLIAITDKDDTDALDDMRVLLEGLLYMYGDILDFTFQYGVLPITAAAFGTGLVLKHLQPSADPMQTFVRRLLSIVSTNILYQGVTSLINSNIHAKFIESIAATSILRLILPSMESYLTYLTAARLLTLAPGLAPVTACLTLWVELLPSSSRGWINELLVTYVILAVINYMILIPTWGAMVVLIMAHYIDHIVSHLDQ